LRAVQFPTETTPDYVALDTVQFCEETVDQDVVELYLETYQDTLSSLAVPRAPPLVYCVW